MAQQVHQPVATPELVANGDDRTARRPEAHHRPCRGNKHRRDLRLAHRHASVGSQEVALEIDQQQRAFGKQLQSWQNLLFVVQRRFRAREAPGGGAGRSAGRRVQRSRKPFSPPPAAQFHHLSFQRGEPPGHGRTHGGAEPGPSCKRSFSASMSLRLSPRCWAMRCSGRSPAPRRWYSRIAVRSRPANQAAPLVVADRLYADPGFRREPSDRPALAHGPTSIHDATGRTR